MALLALGCLVLRLLVFLHLFLLFPGCFLGRLLVLLGRPLGLATIFSDTAVFALSVGWYRPGKARGGQYQDEGGGSFHNFSEGNLAMILTPSMYRADETMVTVSGRAVAGLDAFARWAPGFALAWTAEAAVPT
jgi:hypothetical protein